MNIIQISIYDISEIKGRNFIFGAGDIGKQVLDLFIENNIEVLGIWDNDKLKQGNKIRGVPIISYEELKANSDFNLIIACNYVMQEKERIEQLDNVRTYRVGCTKEELQEKFSCFKDMFPVLIKESEEIKKIYADEFSRTTSDAIIDFIVNCNNAATEKVSSREEHYLIKEVLESLPDDAVFVDLGAFTGEFPVSLMNNDISFKKCYCFDMESNNINKAKENIARSCLENKVEFVEKGVSEKKRLSIF